MERRSNYDITRDRLERDFLQYDQAAMLRRVPLLHDADYLYLTFLRREYRIDRKTGRVEWSDDGFRPQITPGTTRLARSSTISAAPIRPCR